MNFLGNFIVFKLKWVKENEFEFYDKIVYIMFLGDYIVMKFIGEVNMIIFGFLEGIFWDFKENDVV